MSSNAIAYHVISQWSTGICMERIPMVRTLFETNIFPTVKPFLTDVFHTAFLTLVVSLSSRLHRIKGITTQLYIQGFVI